MGGGGGALLVRGIRWRRGASLVLVLCAAVTVAGAAAGPMWGRAAQVSLLDRTLQDAAVSEVAFTADGLSPPFAVGGLGQPPPVPREVVGQVRSEARLPPGLDGLFDEAGEQLSSGRRLVVERPVPTEPGPRPDPAPGPPADRTLGRLLAREGACEQVELTSGACPATTEEVLLSDRSAAELEVAAGDVVLLPELADEPQPSPGTERVPVAYTVAGLYRASSVDATSRFWFDTDVLEYAPAAALGGDAVPARLDVLIVQPDLLLSLTVPGVRVQVERVLRPGAVSLDSADRVARELDEQVAFTTGTNRDVDVAASLAGTLQGTAPDRALVAGTATFVGLQVVVLGWVVLFGLVAITVGGRDDELALAKLRGLRGRALAVHALAEPVALVVLAVPIGVAGAWAAVRLTAAQVLLPGTAVVLTSGTWVAVAATSAGAVLACALAARRSLRLPVADQLRRRSTEATAGPVTTAVLLTLAVVGVVLVLTLGRGAEGALPALLVPVVGGLAAGLVVSRLLRWSLRVGLGRTRRWRLGPYLAVRQVAGQPGGTRTTALITAVTTVSGFAAGAYAVTASQRDVQAAFDVGAERVVHVEATTTPTLLAATREVDPQGGWAMAAVERPGELLAVDSGRFAAAFPVPGGALASPSGLAALVPDDVRQPLLVTGTRVALEIASSTLDRDDVELGVSLRVAGPDGTVTAVPLGALEPGTEQTLTATLPACDEGCTVVSVLLPRVTGTGAVAGGVDLVALEVDGRRHPFDREDWRSTRNDESNPDSRPTGSLFERGVTDEGLELQFALDASSTSGIVRRDVPSELPAVLDDQTTLRLLGTRQLVAGSTLEGGDLPFAVVGRTPVVPRTGGGAVVDLELVSRVEPPRSGDLGFQVWLGPTAPADAPERLEAAGLTVLDVQGRGERRDELARAEPARAQLLLLGAAAAALLAGVAGVATALASSARRRAAEAAALRAMAVPGRVVRGSAHLENALLLLPGVLAGSACAAALVVVCGPVLAEVTGTPAVVAAGTSPADAVLPAVAVALGTCLLLVPVVLAVTRHGDDETRLRQGT